MRTDLENELAAALRHRAGEVPDTPCPPLTASRAPRRGWAVPVVAAAAAVAGMVAAGIVWLPGGGGDQDVTVGTASEVYYSRYVLGTSGGILIEMELWQGKRRTDEWRREEVGGSTLKDGRVVPNGVLTTSGPNSGHCYPAFTTDEPTCAEPGTWRSPTLEFLASASRDPAVIKQQLRDEAVAELRGRTGATSFSEENLDHLQLNYLKDALIGNGVPEDLEVVLHQVVAERFPDIQVTPDTANLLGEKGTGYSLPDDEGKLLTVIFADGRYIGGPNEAVVHGFAPALGEPPSRLID